MKRRRTKAIAAALTVLLATGAIAGSKAEKLDVNARQPDGATPLLWAAFEGDVPETARLLKAGADINAVNNYGVNALLLAADISNTELIQLLLKNGADAKSANADNETALHLVARSGNVEAAKLLLKGGAQVDARERFGEQTPLMWAIARRQPAMVDLLVSKGADINARSAIRDYQRVATAESRAKQLDRGGLTPLLYAARENCRECVETLLKHKVDVNLADPAGVPPLVFAMINNNWDIAKRLIESGADVNQWDIFGQAPLHVAIASLGGGRSSNPLDTDKPSAATPAELVQMLIERGANPNQQTYFRPAERGGGGRGTTPFLVAVGTGNIELVKQLIAKGANVKLATSEGQGAIHAAVQARAPGDGAGRGFGRGGGGPPGAAPAAMPVANGAPRTNPQVELIRLLADAGADVKMMAHRHFLQRTRGGSAIHFAVRTGGNRQVIDELIRLGTDINAKDEDGLTALDYAMGRGYVPFLQMAQPANKPVADYLRSVGANVELEKIPDWPPQGPPIATAVYDAVVWPVDPVGP